jgi:hypothetical protein
MARRRVFVLLLGDEERGGVLHFQLVQEETALSERRRLGIDVEGSESFTRTAASDSIPALP